MLRVALIAAIAVAVSGPSVAHSLSVDPGDLARTLGGSWDSQVRSKSWLVKRSGYTPADCAPGRFLGARNGRLEYFFGSPAQSYPRSADIHVLSFASHRAARQGLNGLRAMVKICPGPIAECPACDGGAVYHSPLPAARIGRNSYGWWGAAAGGLEAAYLTNIAFIKGREVVVVSYRVYNDRDGDLDRSFIPSIPKTKALARALR